MISSWDEQASEEALFKYCLKEEEMKMAAKIINGAEIRDRILKELKKEVEKIKKEHGVVPGLVTILVGENPASVSYVTSKISTAQSLGYKEVQDSYPDDLKEEELLQTRGW